ncbi:lactonase family protein [Acinetobacter sp. MD2(2019)]|uniref:lactonase family protein n=1 Tax=Acinetobacter sp. MD2(2019) TaxID=2605273 RepID=UPI002D1F7477|nr:lactonase family protein [Acinetobacter sp. MD2(2019)]MEB3754131.1 lactonase family protein [Acinetobacter sp. MD2(2019)]
MTFKQLALISILSASSVFSGQAFAAEQVPAQEFFVGTWTSENPSLVPSVTESQGIYRVRLNADGSLIPLSSTPSMSPSWLTLSKNQQVLYSTNEDGRDKNGEISAFQIHANGTLKLLNRVDSQGQQPAHAEVSPDEKYLLISNYAVNGRGAGVAIFALKQDGSIGPLVQKIAFSQGSQVIAKRQDSGHAHSVTFTPDGKNVFLADLGADVIRAYAYQPNAKMPLKAMPEQDLRFSAGSGPRHLLFSKNGEYAYATTEMAAQVTVFAKKAGKYQLLQQENLTTKTDAEAKSASGLIFSPDGKFLYVGNRGKSNEIVVYAVDATSGQLTLSGRYSSSGVEPRAFAFDQTGTYLLVSNVFSNTVSAFKRNPVDGSLTPTHVALQIGHPTDIKFMTK